jgi:hypothetical protein
VLSKVTTTAEERMGLGFATPTPEEERDAKSVPKCTTTAQQKKNPTPAAPKSGKKGDDKSVPKRTTTAEERMGLGSATPTSKEERDAKPIPKRTTTAEERMGLETAAPTSEAKRGVESDDSATATVGRTAPKASNVSGKPSPGVLESIIKTIRGKSEDEKMAEALEMLANDLITAPARAAARAQQKSPAPLPKSPRVQDLNDPYSFCAEVARIDFAEEVARYENGGDDGKDYTGQTTNVAGALEKGDGDEEGDAVGDTFVWVADSFGII